LVRGKPAEKDIHDPFGALMEKPATCATVVRSGSAWAMSRSWNCLMDEQRYLTKHWNEFIAA